MKNKFLFGTTLLSAAIGIMLSSCKADIDLDNISPKAEIDLGVAMPIGSMRATVGDFIGGEDVAKYIHVEPSGLVYFQDTFDISRRFHPLNITDYVGSSPTASASDLSGLGYGTQTTTTTLQIPISFTTHINFKDVNDPDELALGDNGKGERFDAMNITQARFQSIITKTNFPDLKWEWIKTVTLNFGTDFRFNGVPGGSKVVYDKDVNGTYNFGQKIPIEVDHFQLNMMKDPDALPSNTNVNQKTKDITVTFQLEVPAGTTYTVPTDAKINYSLQVNLLTYSSLFGYFKPGKDMRDSAQHVIADEWSSWEKIKEMVLPATDPSIHIIANTNLGVPLQVNVNYLRARTADNKYQVYAKFNGLHQTLWRWEHEPSIQEWSTWSDRTVSYMQNEPNPFPVFENTYDMTKDSQYGEVHNMLLIRPDIIDYSYYISINPNVADGNYNPFGKSITQFYMTNDDSIHMHAVVKIPFIFSRGDGKDDSTPQQNIEGQGVELNYSDTMKNVNISEYSLDSLTRKYDIIDTIKTSNLRMVILAQNSLPFDVDSRFYFLDENYNPVPLKAFAKWNESETSTLPIDTLHIPQPTNISYATDTQTGKRKAIMTEGTNTLIIDLDNNKFNQLAKVKHIGYNAFAGHNTVTVEVLDDSALKFRIALTGNVDAVLKLWSEEDKNK